MIAHLARHPYIERRITSSHYDYIFLSPHLDDVVLSCSGALCSLRAQGCTVLVITLFAGDPWSEPILPDTEESQLPATGMEAASNSAGGK
jgi:LmbE family N-acetylglucosaminyl deacetylase